MKSIIKHRSILALDPRTKLFLFILICLFNLGAIGGEAAVRLAPILSFAPLIFLLASGKWGGSALYAILYTTSYLLETQVLSILSGMAYTTVLIFCGAISHFLPSIMMGYFMMSTVTISEFVAAFERMHIPQTFTIPLSVMFRFLPTVKEEFDSINDAMRMRGMRFGKGNIENLIEYRLIPLLICSVKIGEELSAASLTRGLGTPVRRTNVCKIGFGVTDYIMFAVGIGFIGTVIWLNVVK